MSIFKIAGLGMIASAVALLVKSFRPEMSVQVSIAAGAVFLLYAASEITGITKTVMDAAQGYGLNTQYLGIILKAIGLAYVTQFASDICREGGEIAIASKVELCGKVMIAAVALPGVLSVLDLVSNMISAVS